MLRSLVALFLFVFASMSDCASVYSQMPPIPSNAQRTIERIVGITGSYVANESTLKIRIPRTDIALNVQGQRLPSGFPIESWLAFSPNIRGGGLVMGELRLVEEEVNPVASAALDAGLDITGLANTMMFDQPRLLTMNLAGEGPFDELATGIRKSLDAITGARGGKTTTPRAQFPKTNTIDAAPIDVILSMKGTVTNGIYRASIGQIGVLKIFRSDR